MQPQPPIRVYCFAPRLGQSPARMKLNHAPRITPKPQALPPERDPAACMRRASAYLALGGLAEAARYTRMASEIIEKKRAH